MIWFPFDMDAWNRRTKELDHLERGIYVTLLAWYYGTGGPLPLDWRQLYRIAECQSNEDRNGLKHVLEVAFDCRSTGWHNVRADEEVTRYLRNGDNGVGNGGSVTGISMTASRVTQVGLLITNAKRQRDYRERRTALVGTLRRMGAQADTSMTMGELKKLAKALGITFAGRNEKSDVTVMTEARSHSISSVSVSSGSAGEQGKPEGAEDPKTAQKSGSEDPPTPGGTLAGEACRRMKQQGLWPVNPMHEDLRQLLADGVPVDTFAAVAAEAVALTKGFNWAIAVVKGRIADQTRKAKQAQEGQKSGRGSIKTDRLREWVPELVQAPQAPDFASFDDRMPHAAAD